MPKRKLPQPDLCGCTLCTTVKDPPVLRHQPLVRITTPHRECECICGCTDYFLDSSLRFHLCSRCRTSKCGGYANWRRYNVKTKRAGDQCQGLQIARLPEDSLVLMPAIGASSGTLVPARVFKWEEWAAGPHAQCSALAGGSLTTKCWMAEFHELSECGDNLAVEYLHAASVAAMLDKGAIVLQPGVKASAVATKCHSTTMFLEQAKAVARLPVVPMVAPSADIMIHSAFASASVWALPDSGPTWPDSHPTCRGTHMLS
mgnify:CR=1 FL=1|jgi:hypothetical protein